MHGETMNGWIDIKKQKPPDGFQALFLNEFGDITLDTYEPAKGEQTFDDVGGLRVTAWMPLPDPVERFCKKGIPGRWGTEDHPEPLLVSKWEEIKKRRKKAA